MGLGPETLEENLPQPGSQVSATDDVEGHLLQQETDDTVSFQSEQTSTPGTILYSPLLDNHPALRLGEDISTTIASQSEVSGTVVSVSAAHDPDDLQETVNATIRALRADPSFVVPRNEATTENLKNDKNYPLMPERDPSTEKIAKDPVLAAAREQMRRFESDSFLGGEGGTQHTFYDKGAITDPAASEINVEAIFERFFAHRTGKDPDNPEG